MKITITLNKRSVDYFKAKASQSDTQYRRMIRRLLEAYVSADADGLMGRQTRTARMRATG